MSNHRLSVAANPTVSVITPTWNRESLLPFAYRSFSSQNMDSLEWIVIDDSDEPSAFMEGLNDPRVIYRHLPSRKSIGEKRNLAIELSRSDIIAHFDDDEVYAHNYLSVMLERMRSQGADFIKLSGFFIYSKVYEKFAYWDLMRKTGLHFCWSGEPATLYDMPEGSKVFLENHLGFGFSYIYKKRLWEEHPFELVSFNEDGLFAVSARARGARIALPADDSGLCLHVLHTSNSSKSFPQYVLPDVLVERHFPHFWAALDLTSSR